MRFTRKILFSMLLAIVSVVSCLSLTACGSDNAPPTLKSPDGIVVEGGDFEDGAVLETSKIDSKTTDYEQVLSAIASEDYAKDKPVYVFEISVKKDNVKIQPNGKVKVSVPIDADLSGYDVLHIKDDGKIERLSVTYKNGIATFETDSFSKFVFVKKSTPVDSGDTDASDPDKSDDSGDNDASNPDKGDDSDNTDDTTTKYAVSFGADRISSTSHGRGGPILNVNDVDLDDQTFEFAEGTEYTVVSKPATTDYSFVGWYEATKREEATEDTFLSSDPTYTFTITKNMKILALYAYKDDIVELTLEANGYGFSYRNGEPTTTRVSSSAEADKPYYDYVAVRVVFGDGRIRTYYKTAVEFDRYVDFDLGGLDYSKVGTYTLTYTYKYNSNIKATLPVQVVDSAHTLTITGDDNLYFYCNDNNYIKSYTKVLAEGRLVTLSARPKDNKAFIGWYNEGENLVSSNLVYCFEMPNHDVTLHGKYEASSVSLNVSIDDYSWNVGELIDDFGNNYGWINNTLHMKKGEKVSFTIREKGSYEFLGWYDVTGDEQTLITTNKKIELTLTENKSIKTEFRERVKSIEINSTTLSNEGFVDGKLGFTIGDDEIDYKNFTVNAKGVAGSDMTLSASDYTIDDSSLDPSTAGTYTITYKYKLNENIQTKIQIVVVDPETAVFAFTKGYSYLDHEYNGKATFISLQDVKVNGIALYNFKSSSKIWGKISYKWIDKTTGQEVDEKYTKGVDITINGTVVKDFGGKNDKLTIGNEFGGPIKAGSYTFELSLNGKTVISQDSTISTQTYKKITTDSEFKTNENSSWINFEFYYYTIIAQADNGKYYIMQMPSIGTDNVEAEAREISVDNSGNAIVGGDNDFAFTYFKYFVSDSSNRMELMTGYYGSYIIRSSDNSIGGSLGSSPYIYRTGQTYISDGKIYRDYGDKTNYGMSVEFDENGVVTIHSKSGSENGRLRLVKDGDKYVFTSIPEDSDTRDSFDIFIYRTIIDTTSKES